MAFLSLTIIIPVVVWQAFEVNAKYQALYAREAKRTLRWPRAVRQLFFGYAKRVLDAQTAISVDIERKQHSPEEISIRVETVSDTPIHKPIQFDLAPARVYIHLARGKDDKKC